MLLAPLPTAATALLALLVSPPLFSPARLLPREGAVGINLLTHVHPTPPLCVLRMQGAVGIIPLVNPP